MSKESYITTSCLFMLLVLNGSTWACDSDEEQQLPLQPPNPSVDETVNQAVKQVVEKAVSQAVRPREEHEAVESDKSQQEVTESQASTPDDTPVSRKDDGDDKESQSPQHTLRTFRSETDLRFNEPNLLDRRLERHRMRRKSKTEGELSTSKLGLLQTERTAHRRKTAPCETPSESGSEKKSTEEMPTDHQSSHTASANMWCGGPTPKSTVRGIMKTAEHRVRVQSTKHAPNIVGEAHHRAKRKQDASHTVEAAMQRGRQLTKGLNPMQILIRYGNARYGNEFTMAMLDDMAAKDSTSNGINKDLLSAKPTNKPQGSPTSAQPTTIKYSTSDGHKQDPQLANPTDKSHGSTTVNDSTSDGYSEDPQLTKPINKSQGSSTSAQPATTKYSTSDDHNEDPRSAKPTDKSQGSPTSAHRTAGGVSQHEPSRTSSAHTTNQPPPPPSVKQPGPSPNIKQPDATPSGMPTSTILYITIPLVVLAMLGAGATIYYGYLCKGTPTEEPVEPHPDLEQAISSSSQLEREMLAKLEKVDALLSKLDSLERSGSGRRQDMVSAAPTTPEGVFQPRPSKPQKPLEPVTLIRKSSLRDTVGNTPERPTTNPRLLRSRTPPYIEPVTLVSITRQETPPKVSHFDGNVEQSDECTICMSSSKNIAVVPCGHKCCCLACKDILKRAKSCPICRGPIDKLIQIFD